MLLMPEYKVKTLREYSNTVERYERVGDPYIMPETFVVIRVDGRRFGGSWFTDEKHWDYPYGERITEGFLAAGRKMMWSGFKVSYAFAHGDEVSVLLDRSESANLRRKSNLYSLLASAASVSYTRNYGQPLIFHAKLSELPREEHVIDYFVWQRQCGVRNFFSQLFLRHFEKEGLGSADVDKKIGSMSNDEKIIYARELGLEIDRIPLRNIYGTAFWWEESEGDAAAKAPYHIVEAQQLPVDDQEYAIWVDERMAGPAFLPDKGQKSVDKVNYDPNKSRVAAKTNNSTGKKVPFKLGR
ncbi:hypothetical protein BVY02_01780 [bacterium J17]|nr:hypothetical protein BVY02_01780 [bacterium J17]